MMARPFLVFGGSGQVGTELGRRAEGRPMVLLNRHDVDIKDAEAVAGAIARHVPSVVINAAAYTAVDRAESERELAFAVNSDASGHIARTCAAFSIPLLHISTDYVFDGSGEHEWTEDAPINPLNAYGASKAAGEEAVRRGLNRHVILRTAWVVSPFGENFVKTILRLARERNELRVVADQFGGPTMAADIAGVLLKMADKVAAEGAPECWGTFHFTGRPFVSWHQFATEIVAQAAPILGRRPKVTAISTADFPTSARRPANSRLNISRLERIYGIKAPDWRVSLQALLAELLATEEK